MELEVKVMANHYLILSRHNDIILEINNILTDHYHFQVYGDYRNYRFSNRRISGDMLLSCLIDAGSEQNKGYECNICLPRFS